MVFRGFRILWSTDNSNLKMLEKALYLVAVDNRSFRNIIYLTDPEVVIYCSLCT